MKRKTTKHRRSAQRNVLEVRVMSPRIAWFGFLRLAGRFTKLACVLVALAGIGWGVWRGLQHAFYKNPDFRLQVIDLNPNPVIDELGIASAAGIDLTKNPSIFEVSVTQATANLKALPALSDARIERHLPGTLMVRVVPRIAKAWIRCPAPDLPAPRTSGGLLVDDDGIVFPCSSLQLETASALPVIDLPASSEFPVQAGRKIRHPDLAHGFLLLDAAREADPDAARWIDSIRKANDWSLELVTRQGTCATFSLGDHARQIESLRAALDHAGEKGYDIATINLIPKYNIPITLRGEAPAPRAVPVSAADNPTTAPNRRARDISRLINRN